MRNAFFRVLQELGEEREEVMFLTADLGYKLFDAFEQAFPGRCKNMGVSESNMISVAAGLALEGKRPFVYSIVPFATLRCLEQIRNDICSMKLSVVIVGVGAGFSYGQNGPTHHGVDDVGAMRLFPGMTVVAPCDPLETGHAMRSLIQKGGPAYLRLGRAGEPSLTQMDAPFDLRFPSVLREGSDVALLATGSIAAEALKAAEVLRTGNIEASVLSVHTLKPLCDVESALIGRKPSLIVTVEEHGPVGGLYDALLPVASQWSWPTRVRRISAPDHFIYECDTQDGLRKRVGLDAQSIAEAVFAWSGFR